MAVAGTGTSDSRPAQLHLHIQDGSSSGTIIVDGARVEITTIGRDAYLRSDQLGLQAVGTPAEAARPGANRWLKYSQQAIGMEGYSLDSFVAEFPNPDRPLNPTVEQTELDGKKVVVVSEQDGAKLYVANTGVAYPLRAD